mmetsp:Transcript_149102/g.371446  ORF Transcript_149102/g.371446 Transcript_149102/m.371446 type:complete len:897 (-) Transcript_149102:265-2955(-)
MAKLVDVAGKEAIIGQSVGYWLADADFVSTSELEVKAHGRIGFLRDWPSVYTTSKALKSLIGKKGKCAGKRVGVVGEPSPEEVAQVKGLTFHRLHSFSNAELVESKTGFQIVRGWAVFEHLDLATSAAFVAERYWWNTLPDGKWVDFTPRPDGLPELLLSEAAGDASKQRSTLTEADFVMAAYLFKQRFSLTLARAAQPQPALAAQPPASETKAKETPTRTSAPAAESPAPAAAAAAPAGSLRELTKRVSAGDIEAVRELETKITGNEEQCIQVAGDGIIAPLVKMLGESTKQEDALKLLLLVTDAGVGQKNVDVASNLISAGVVDPLVKLLSSDSTNLKELAPAVLGNLAHESPANQDKVAKMDVFRPLIDLLSAEIGPAQEAAYAIWNLTVGHEENSAKVVRLGAVPKLAELLKSPSDVAQENAAGALMHVTMSAEARAAIVQADAIPRLCELLKPSYEPEVSSQAAGALLNLASDCPEYAKLIIKGGAVGPLVNLVKDGPDLAREYAAGALMNLLRNEMEVADQAAKAGAIPALASLLSRPTGHSEALGALANLASGSSERQVSIYKAQVTRKSVSLLADPDLDIRRSAVALIMNLSPQAKIKERIVEAGALKPLTLVLKDEDDIIRERAAGAFANLFNDHSANVHAGFTQAPEMIPALVEIIQVPTHSEDAKRQAAHALAMLAAEDGPCDAVWSAGAGAPMLAMLKDQVAEAALGIMNLSWRWPEVKQELAKGGAVEYLTKMLKSNDIMAKEYAAGALMNMTAGSMENAEKAVGVVTLLVNMLKAEAVQAAEWSAGALANITRMGAEPQKEAISAGAATALAALLPKVTSNGKTLLVLAFTSLAEHQAAAVQKALSGNKERSRLRDFRDSGNEELQDYTNTLVEKIGGGFTL